MNLDIRVPIGLLFTSLGVLLVAYGLISGPEIYHRSLDININLWWGLVMLVFGALMALFGFRTSRSPLPETTPQPPETA